jgi:hypothetical protein
MNHIGKYQGTPCYECSDREYKDALNKGQDDGKQIFIINGVMVRQNVIIGIYDGKHVKDSYDGKVYYHTYDKNDVMQFKAPAAKEEYVEEVKVASESRVTAVSYEELVKQDIDFGKYSAAVDKFFALLEV